MTTVHRITRIVDLLRHWDFFRTGILYEARYFRYAHSIDVYRKILCSLVSRNPKAWVGVAFNADSTPIGFILSHDITPLFAEEREFEVSMFYFTPGNKDALRLLQDRLDSFCRMNGVSRYYLSTSSFSSSAERVFKNAWRGLERSNTVFKRNLVTNTTTNASL